MARVALRTDQGRSTRERLCATCRKPILLGDRYYKWVPRTGPRGGYVQHQTCGYPRPSQLSSAKTAQVQDLVQGFDPGEWETIEDLVAMAEDIAQTAEDVADEYESGADSMPDNLQYSPTAEAMRDVAERLREYAEAIRAFTGEDQPEDADDDALQSWRDDQVSELSSLLDDVPSYEG